ncbi:MAG TPA: glycosyltransferase [Syntrophorhabdus sp.]|nr:glycosyltransferase [Syntrophorhabdus sp.]
MRILAISYLFPNPCQQNNGIFVLNRLKALSKLHEITIVAPIPWFPFRHCLPDYPDLRSVPLVEEIDGIHVYHPRFFVIPRFFKWLDPFLFLLCTLPILLKLCTKKSYDIIDVHWVYPDILSGLFLSRITKKPFITTIRGKEAVCYEEKSMRKRLLDRWLKKSDKVICLSAELADIAHAIGVDSGKIHVVSNGVDIETFRPLDPLSCRRKLGIPLDRKIILSIGYLIERKGFHHIIDSMPGLISKYNDVLLYIVGSPGAEGNYLPQLEEKITNMNLEDRIFLVGARPNNELPLWYGSANVFCLATSGEGSPNVVMEALACGCPAVVSSVGGIPDIMSERFLGNVFNLTDKNGLAEALDNFFSREWNRQRIRKHMERYSWNWCAENVDNVYREVSK